mmetsp:Transcript_13004/g.54461  ORF Transcript_13004/g.54461 Transcript_13004/m.54461 type:complete len:442 (+) Transcript_13004:1150-2475(+)
MARAPPSTRLTSPWCSCGTCARRARARYTRSHALERARLATCATTGRATTRAPSKSSSSCSRRPSATAAAATSRNERASRESSVNVPYTVLICARVGLCASVSAPSASSRRVLAVVVRSRAAPASAHALALSASRVEASPLRQRLSPGFLRARERCVYPALGVEGRLLDAAAQHLGRLLAHDARLCGKQSRGDVVLLVEQRILVGLVGWLRLLDSRHERHKFGSDLSGRASVGTSALRLCRRRRDERYARRSARAPNGRLVGREALRDAAIAVGRGGHDCALTEGAVGRDGRWRGGLALAQREERRRATPARATRGRFRGGRPLLLDHDRGRAAGGRAARGGLPLAHAALGASLSGVRALASRHHGRLGRAQGALVRLEQLDEHHALLVGVEAELLRAPLQLAARHLGDGPLPLPHRGPRSHRAPPRRAPAGEDARTDGPA